VIDHHRAEAPVCTTRTQRQVAGANRTVAAAELAAIRTGSCRIAVKEHATGRFSARAVDPGAGFLAS